MDTIQPIISRVEKLAEPAPVKDVLRTCNSLIAADALLPFEGAVSWEIDFPDIDLIFTGRSESLEMAIADIQNLLQAEAPSPSNLVSITFTTPENLHAAS